MDENRRFLPKNGGKWSVKSQKKKKKKILHNVFEKRWGEPTCKILAKFIEN